MNNGAEKQPQHVPTPPEVVMARAKELSSRAATAASHQLEQAERQVKKYPLATMGIAFGSGLALGAIGWALLRPKPPTLRDRFDDAAVARRMRKLLDRVW